MITGERYKMTTKEARRLLQGEFGQTVKKPNPEVKKRIVGDLPCITCRPADLIEPQLEKLEQECAQWKEQDEDVLTYAMFPAVAKEYFAYRETQKTRVDRTAADFESMAYPV